MRKDIKAVDLVDPSAFISNDFISEYEVIPLETRDSCLISSIHKLHVMDNKLYVTDGNMNAIYLFDEDGKYINSIENRGGGSNEYIYINSFEIDPMNKKLIIGDSFSKRVFVYNSLGYLQQTLQLDYMPKQIIGFNNGFLNLYAGSNSYYDDVNMENHHIHVIDSTGKVINTILPDQTPKRINITSSLAANHSSTGEVMYWPMLSDTVYQIKSFTEVSPEYVFNNLSSYKLPTAEDRMNMEYVYGKQNDLVKKEQEGYLVSTGDFVSTDNFMFFLFGWNKYLYLFYSKQNGKSLMLAKENIDKSENGMLRACVGNRILTASQDWFYASMNYMDADRLNSKLPEGNLKNAIRKMQPEDNPIIVRFKVNIK